MFNIVSLQLLKRSILNSITCDGKSMKIKIYFYYPVIMYALTLKRITYEMGG